PLLLLQPDGVVGLGAATSAAVLTRRVGPLLEVLDGLRGQRNPEGAREPDLPARTVLRSHELLPVVSSRHASTAPERWLDAWGRLQVCTFRVHRAGLGAGPVGGQSRRLRPQVC